MKESSIENYLKTECKKRDILCFKFLSGHNGVPDRILIGNGKVVFLELKRPGQYPRKLQKHMLKNLTEHGAIATWADSKNDIICILDTYF